MAPSEIELYAALRPVVAAFDRLGVAYFIGGSVASGVLGEPRQTLDADLVAALFGKNAGQLVGLLQAEFYADLPSMLSAIERRASFNLIHLETMVKVDVFVLRPEPFFQSQMRRRVLQPIGPGESPALYVATAEDTVLAKLDWYRQGGEVSDRQWRDILGVLKVQADALDRAYLRNWATELQVTDLLRRALDDAGLPPDPA